MPPPCNSPSSPQPSDYQRLLFASETIRDLGPHAHPDVLKQAFGEYRKIYWTVMTEAPDVAPFEAGFLVLERTDAGDFSKVMEVVNLSLSLLP